jgi:hypothetical protein
MYMFWTRETIITFVFNYNQYDYYVIIAQNFVVKMW